MATRYVTVEGDLIDVICYREYGSTDFLGDLIAANRHILELPLHLPAGIDITLPSFATRRSRPKRETVQLWD